MTATKKTTTEPNSAARIARLSEALERAQAALLLCHPLAMRRLELDRNLIPKLNARIEQLSTADLQPVQRRDLQAMASDLDRRVAAAQAELPGATAEHAEAVAKSDDSQRRLATARAEKESLTATHSAAIAEAREEGDALIRSGDDAGGLRKLQGAAELEQQGATQSVDLLIAALQAVVGEDAAASARARGEVAAAEQRVAEAVFNLAKFRADVAAAAHIEALVDLRAAVPAGSAWSMPYGMRDVVIGVSNEYREATAMPSPVLFSSTLIEQRASTVRTQRLITDDDLLGDAYLALPDQVEVSEEEKEAERRRAAERAQIDYYASVPINHRERVEFLRERATRERVSV